MIYILCINNNNINTALIQGKNSLYLSSFQFLKFYRVFLLVRSGSMARNKKLNWKSKKTITGKSTIFLHLLFQGSFWFNFNCLSIRQSCKRTKKKYHILLSFAKTVAHKCAWFLCEIIFGSTESFGNYYNLQYSNLEYKQCIPYWFGQLI